MPVFKDNWGRPRPRETMTFGGENTFQAPFVVSDQGGKSFPCGHCSVGFACCASSLTGPGGNRRSAGSLLEVGLRPFCWVYISVLPGFAVGAHYLSDVLSSAWSVFLVALADGLFASCQATGRNGITEFFVWKYDEKTLEPMVA